METTHISLIIIGITVLTSIIAFSNRELFERFKFNAFSIKHSRQYWRFLTYALLHADFIHLIINMMVFYSFSPVVEYAFKMVFAEKWIMMYLLLYIGGVAVSVLPSYGKNKDNPLYNAVGASGAVSAIVFASILFIPTGALRLFFIPIDIPAFIFGGLYLVYSYIMAKRGRGNIGHDAHFWGAVYGIVFTAGFCYAYGFPVLKVFWEAVSGYIGL